MGARPVCLGGKRRLCFGERHPDSNHPNVLHPAGPGACLLEILDRHVVISPREVDLP